MAEYLFASDVLESLPEHRPLPTPPRPMGPLGGYELAVARRRLTNARRLESVFYAGRVFSRLTETYPGNDRLEQERDEVTAFLRSAWSFAGEVPTAIEARKVAPAHVRAL